MKYINEINAFNDWLKYNTLPTGEIALWYALMHINNISCWADEFTVANLTLQSLTGLSRQGLDRARNGLIQRGRVKYKKGISNKAGKYKIISFESQIIGTVMPECQKTGTERTQQQSQGDTQSGHSSSTLNRQDYTKQDNDDHIAECKKVMDFYTGNFGIKAVPAQAQLLLSYLDDGISADLIIEAMRITVLSNIYNLRYTEGIINNWTNLGIKTIEQYKEYEAKRQMGKGKEPEDKSQPVSDVPTEAEVEAACIYLDSQYKKFINKNPNASDMEIASLLNGFSYSLQVRKAAFEKLNLMEYWLGG
ncbi:MAG: DnaD domain-containing protein [Caulobacteraceae bacterium]